MLIKEDKIYDRLTENYINSFMEYYIMRSQYPRKNNISISLDFNKMIDDNDLFYDRIAIRLGIYSGLDQLGDNNWYQKLSRGIYLTDNTDVDKEIDYYYYFIYSSWCVVNYIKNTTNDEYFDDYSFLNRYTSSFIDPFTESILVKNNFKINENYDYVLKINNYNNKFSSYKTAAIIYYENNLKNFVQSILYGSITEINAYFIDMIIGVESFLELIDDELREHIYMESINIYRMARTQSNPCTNCFFELFSTFDFINKENKKEYIKE